MNKFQYFNFERNAHLCNTVRLVFTRLDPDLLPSTKYLSSNINNEGSLIGCPLNSNIKAQTQLNVNTSLNQIGGNFHNKLTILNNFQSTPNRMSVVNKN
jgi:hypothetical protein